MTPETDRITRRQFTALLFLCLLSPLFRRIPQVMAAEAGYMAWVAVRRSLEVRSSDT